MIDELEKVDALPTSLQDIAETLGVRVALKLIENFGGTEQKFPKKPGDDHPVLVALGKQDGVALCNYLSGGTLYIPHARKRANLQQQILALRAQGKNAPEIARALGISQRWVRRMLNSTDQTNQLTLF